MGKLNIGMIGAGFIGQLGHLMNFIEIPNCKVLALAELRPELRKKVAERFEIPRTYSSHLELLKDPEIDAVVVVTPRALTGPIVLDCLNAGMHVLSEKPMAGSSHLAKLLLDAAEENNVKYAVGYMKRFDEGVEAAHKILKDALQTGCLGEIISVSASCYMGNSYCNSYGHIITSEDPKKFSSQTGWSVAPDWVPNEHHQRFDAYLNTYSHVTNLLRYLFNQTPNIAFASLTECVGHLAVLKFDHFYATLQTGKMSHRGWSEEINIIFSEGEIKLQLPPALLRNVPASVTVYRGGKIQERTRLCPNWSWSFRRQAEAFVNDILDDSPMRNSAKEAYLDIVLIEKLWRYEIAHHIKNYQVA
ncbi:MAG: hypothetical protein A3F11_10065 [Gammaproteobacteria bacterium RIFCSPHIGHO2_12_FULL_37_14]|nr:MAG: hypothetical protein A3F11_10065 [Gammaproteobacteria bacterium RIFCSPHIGHO2_12_FULL_37_14]